MEEGERANARKNKKWGMGEERGGREGGEVKRRGLKRMGEMGSREGEKGRRGGREEVRGEKRNVNSC